MAFSLWIWWSLSALMSHSCWSLASWNVYTPEALIGLFVTYHRIPQLCPSPSCPALLAKVPALVVYSLVYTPPPWLLNVDIGVHKLIKTVAAASKLAICVILCLTLSFFSSLAHQTTRESTEIACPRGIWWPVMVVTQKCNDPTYKPLPTFSQC